MANIDWNFLFKGEVAESTINGAHMIFKSIFLVGVTSEELLHWGYYIHSLGWLLLIFVVFIWFPVFIFLEISSVLYFFYSFTVFPMVFRIDMALEKASKTHIIMFKVSFSSPSFISILQTIKIPSCEMQWDDSEVPALKLPNKTLRLWNFSSFPWFPIFKWRNCS